MLNANDNAKSSPIKLISYLPLSDDDFRSATPKFPIEDDKPPQSGKFTVSPIHVLPTVKPKNRAPFLSPSNSTYRSNTPASTLSASQKRSLPHDTDGDYMRERTVATTTKTNPSASSENRWNNETDIVSASSYSTNSTIKHSSPLVMMPLEQLNSQPHDGKPVTTMDCYQSMVTTLVPSAQSISPYNTVVEMSDDIEADYRLAHRNARSVDHQKTVEPKNDISPNFNSDGNGNNPSFVAPGYLLTQAELQHGHRQAYHSFWRTLSGIYCIMLIVLGICLPIAETTSIEIRAKYNLIYYILLYSVSVIFIVVMLVLLAVNGRNADDDDPNSVDQRKIESFTAQDSRHTADKQQQYDPRRPLNKVPNSSGDESELLHAQNTPVLRTCKSIPQTPVSGETDNFYLRLGAVLFGLISLVLLCFEIGQYFEHTTAIDDDSGPNDDEKPLAGDALAVDRVVDISIKHLIEDVSVEKVATRKKCRRLIALIAPVTNFLFIFIQTYFVFVNYKIRIDRCATMIRFGLMHLVGTNLCIWVQVLVEETKHAIEHYAEEVIHGTPTFYVNMYSNNSRVISSEFEAASKDWFVRYIEREGEDRSPLVSTYCRNSTVMGRIHQSATPFLFPFLVEYTLICAATFYVMWDQMGIDPIKYNRQQIWETKLNKTSSVVEQSSKTEDKILLNVSSASRGLFVGLVFFECIVISMILFFVWISMPAYQRLALIQAYTTEIALYIVCAVTALVAIVKLRQLKFDFNAGSALSDLLLTIGQFGVYVITGFTMICSFQKSFHSTEWRTQMLVLAAAVLETVQTSIQTLFLLDATRRRPAHESHVRLKPARELVTFLLMCNIGVWTVKSFESWRHQLHPVQIGFYGFWTWALVTHICSPLMIFYRFHSSVMLSEVWAKTHRLKKSEYVKVNSK